MAKDAPSPPDSSSSLPLDVFRVPGLNDAEAESRDEADPSAQPPAVAERASVARSNPVAAGNGAAAAPSAAAESVNGSAAPEATVSEPPHEPAASLPPVDSSIASVVIDASALAALSMNEEPTAPPDVPTVRLRPAARSGKRLGREVLLAVVGMAFCLMLYGAGSELLSGGQAPTAASASIGAARPQGDSVNAQEQSESAGADATDAIVPLSPPAEQAVPEPASSEATAQPDQAAPAGTEDPLPLPFSKPPAAVAEESERPAARPAPRRPLQAKPTGALAPESPPVPPARAIPATKNGNVFDTPLRPPAE